MTITRLVLIVMAIAVVVIVSPLKGCCPQEGQPTPVGIPELEPLPAVLPRVATPGVTARALNRL